MTPPGTESAPFHPQLALLMEIQDLRAKYRELASESVGALEHEHFHIDLDEARDQLGRKIGELEDTLAPAIRARYDRIAPQRDRVVVPVIGGVCYGCFVSIPTATVGDPETHRDLRSCEGCGCFIYVLP